MTTLRSAKDHIYIGLENGLTVSIQYGKGYYGSNYDHRGSNDDLPPTETVEIGLLIGGTLVDFDGNCVVAYVPVMEAINLIKIFAEFPENVTPAQVASIIKASKLIGKIS